MSKRHSSAPYSTRLTKRRGCKGRSSVLRHNLGTSNSFDQLNYKDRVIISTKVYLALRAGGCGFRFSQTHSYAYYYVSRHPAHKPLPSGNAFVTQEIPTAASAMHRVPGKGNGLPENRADDTSGGDLATGHLDAVGLSLGIHVFCLKRTLESRAGLLSKF